MNYKVACCLCVRDCGSFLPDIFTNLDLLAKEFKYFNVVFVYDNCKDNSEQLLLQYANRSKHKVIVIKQTDNNSPHRTVRIANARNKCLDIVYNELEDIDFHIMIDADDVNIKKWDIELIKKYLNNNEWDALSFNKEGYYDIWALMYNNYKHHCWGFACPYNISVKIINTMKDDLIYKLKQLEGDLFECLSAFGGFAIYRTNVFKDIKYDGYYQNVKKYISDEERMNTINYLENIIKEKIFINERQIEHCEHLNYHLSAIQNNHARIRISKYCL